MNYSDLITLILTQLRTHVNSDQFLEQFRRSKAFVRHRKLTLKQVVAYLVSDGCHVLMRLNKGNHLTRLGSDDFSWTAASADGKPVLYRIVRVPLPEQSNEEAEYLVTNITDPSISPALLYNLYFERWNIETKYRELKFTL